MNMALIDWLIVGFVFVILGCFAVYTNRFSRSVSDFMTANRCAGRYLLGGAELMASISATMIIAQFEQYYQGGVGIIWWGFIIVGVGVIMTMSGWIQYRFRETRAMTMAEFFAMRYSRKFRVFAGILAWASGIVNFAIHPAVTSRLIVYFCGLPEYVEIFGIQINVFFLVMLIIMSAAVIITLTGGQVTLLLTDFLQSQMVLTVCMIVVIILLINFGWGDISHALKATEQGQALINPYKQSRVETFNIWFFIMVGVLYFYNMMSFQGNQGFYTSAKSPHEAKMSRIIGFWRGIPYSLLILLPPLIAFVIFNNPEYSAQAESLRRIISNISDPYAQTQMRVPIVLANILPAGVVGLLLASFLSCSIATGDTYLHAWGSILVQDVILPFRKKKLSPKQHLLFLRLSVIGVAVLVIIGASLIPVRDFVWMYFQITGAIYAGGIGAVIIGGLYWKRGTTQGAWVATITGSVLCTGGFIIQAIWTKVPLLSNYSPVCPLNGLHITFIVSIISIILYVAVSLITCKELFNLDKMLHRGKYSIGGEHIIESEKISLIRKLTGIDKEFTRGDKIAAIAMMSWTLFWIFALIGVSIFYTFGTISDDLWAIIWGSYVYILTIAALPLMIWLFIGGVSDLKYLFKTLNTKERDDNDNGQCLSNGKESEKDHFACESSVK